MKDDEHELPSLQNKDGNCSQRSWQHALQPNGCNEIKFSHKTYFKLQNIDADNKIVLLEVFIKTKDDLYREFISYDTAYTQDGRGIFYVLPEGKLLVLLFCDINDRLFTTIRRYTPSKLEHYMSKRGELFRVVFNE